MGLGLAMSSTAFVLQVLAERKQLTTRHGRSAFAILLFQDLDGDSAAGADPAAGERRRRCRTPAIPGSPRARRWR